jgi:hypothetical protein
MSSRQGLSGVKGLLYTPPLPGTYPLVARIPKSHFLQGTSGPQRYTKRHLRENIVFGERDWRQTGISYQLPGDQKTNSGLGLP